MLQERERQKEAGPQSRMAQGPAFLFWYLSFLISWTALNYSTMLFLAKSIKDDEL